jgi:hypothetical protein
MKELSDHILGDLSSISKHKWLIHSWKTMRALQDRRPFSKVPSKTVRIR